MSFPRRRESRVFDDKHYLEITQWATFQVIFVKTEIQWTKIWLLAFAGMMRQVDFWNWYYMSGTGDSEILAFSSASSFSISMSAASFSSSCSG
jgi:hypothetical protein